MNNNWLIIELLILDDINEDLIMSSSLEILKNQERISLFEIYQWDWETSQILRKNCWWWIEIAGLLSQFKRCYLESNGGFYQAVEP